MDKQYSWKRTDEIEIDLADLIQRLCRQWKWCAVCAVVFALLLGMYGWMKGRENLDAVLPDEAEETVLTETEEQEVSAAVLLEYETRGLQEYLDNSILMQLDPYHRNKTVMLYSIEQAERKELPQITESYLNFILNGGVADRLRQSGNNDWKMDKNCLAELISAYQKTYSFPYQVSVNSPDDSSMVSESLFYIEVTGKNASAAEKMAQKIQEILTAYSEKVKKSAGSHKLRLVDTVSSVISDSGLQTQQHDKKTLLASNLANLQTMTDAFSREQMAVYRAAANIEKSEDEEDVFGNETSGFRVKYIAAGFLGGIFVYCAVFLVWYVLCDTVKSVKELKRMYTFPVYGGILPDDKGKSKDSFFRMCRKGYENEEEKVLNRIRLACIKKRMDRICAVSDLALSVQERECMDSMTERLKNLGIVMTVIDDASGNIGMWDRLTDIGNVLVLCRIDATTHQMIDDAMKFYEENGIAVAGAAAFLQSR